MVLLAAILFVQLTSSQSCGALIDTSIVVADERTIALDVCLPRGQQLRAAVLMIGGSGPDSRDVSTFIGRRGPNRAFASIRNELVRSGFAVVRFDEMGTGGSSGDYAREATTTVLAQDVAHVAEFVALYTTGRPVVLLGFSEGSVIAAMATSNVQEVRATVLMAAPAETGERIIEQQHAVAMAALRDASLASRLEYEQALSREHSRRSATELWYQHFLTIDPMRAYRASNVPVLLLQGGRDQQVTPKNADRIERALLADGRRVTLKLFPRLHHGFMDPRKPETDAIDPRVTHTIVDWLERRFP